MSGGSLGHRRLLHRRGLITGLGAAVVAAGAPAWSASTMRTVVFDTGAFYEPAAEAWVVPLHAWVSKPAESSARKAAIEALLKRRYGLEVTDANRTDFDERINLLLADNTPRARVRLAVDDASFQLPATARNGHSRLEAVLKGSPTDSLLPFRLTTPGATQPAYAQRIGSEGTSIISDIDDTVKNTGVLDRRRLWESTFYKPFSAVPGMVALITRLAGPERAVHYVSSSPWHLYGPLRSWLLADRFPMTELHLKHIRLKDSSILNILASPETTKPPQIDEIIGRYPRRTFMLVGDSGEKDPEIYAAVARKHMARIVRILIRRVPGDPSPTSRFDAVFAGLPRKLWQVFDDPAEVS